MIIATETIISGAGIEQNLKHFLLVLSVALCVAMLPQIFSWLRIIPYTLLLVIVGLVLAVVNVRFISLSPNLILLIFLPPLLFEAAWNLQWSKLKRDLVPISLYAIAGVVISVVGVAFALNKIAGMPLAIALLIGASVSATDPVSVIALFKELGVEKRLTVLMEGESLFNDGVAVVAFSSLVGLSLGTSELSISISSTVGSFLAVVGIGIAVGSLIGFGISYLTQRFDLPLVEQSLTLVAAYGTYIITDDLGGSGVIAVVTTGLILGNFGSCIGMQPSTRLAVTQFWDFVAFFVNSMLFLLLGDQIRFTALRDNLGLIAVTAGAMLLTRAISVFGLGWLSHWLVKSRISLPNQTVLWWGGLRGSVSLALASSVPAVIQQRDQTIAIVFGVVLFTLLVQGLTTKPMLEKLGLLTNQELDRQYQEVLARRAALSRVLNRLSQIVNRNEIEPKFYDGLKTYIQEELECFQEEINQMHTQYPHLQDLTIERVQEDLVAIEADTYAEFVRSGRLQEIPDSLLQKAFKEKISKDNKA